jgi:hypothetical protein
VGIYYYTIHQPFLYTTLEFLKTWTQIKNNVPIKLKMRECKLRSGVNWRLALKHKFIKQMGIKQGLGVCRIYELDGVRMVYFV